MDTIGELWHKLRPVGPSRPGKRNTWARTDTDTRRQDRGSRPVFPVNPVTLLSLLPLPCFRLMLREQQASAFNAASQFFIPLAPPSYPTHPLSLHFRNGCGNTSTDLQTASRLPSGAEGEQRPHSPDTHLPNPIYTLEQICLECERQALTKSPSQLCCLLWTNGRPCCACAAD